MTESLRQTPAGMAARFVVLIAWTIAGAGGCMESLRAGGQTMSQTERLARAYADLESGRFHVIADFEADEGAAHTELFRMESASGSEACELLPGGGNEQTGKRCLAARFGGPEDTLVVSNEHAVHWAVDRDWRHYTILLGSVRAPEAAPAMELTVVAGVGDDATSVHSRMMLEPGWNQLRLDLAEVGEYIPIDDVREIRMTLPQAEAPVELLLDDLILADNRKDVFGSSRKAETGMYIQRQGRRWNVGLAGRFELGFANGQVVHWFDLENDPNRLNNLLTGTTLGPSLVVLPSLGDEDEWHAAMDFSLLGDTILARQQILEASPLHVVIRCQWRFVGDDVRSAPDDAPFHKWTYSVYAGGEVFVETECTTHTATWNPESLGLLASIADDGSAIAYAHRAAMLGDAEDLRQVCYAYAQPVGRSQAGLLYVMHDSRKTPLMRVVPDRANGAVSLMASGGQVEGATQSWSSLLGVWPASNCEPDRARARAMDYSFPAMLSVQVGQLVNDTEGDWNGDGFNEARGYHVIRPDGDLVRFTIDASTYSRFSPVFLITDLAGREGWVYVNNAIIDSSARDAAGNLIFQIPGQVPDKTSVEVVLRARGPRPASSVAQASR